MRFLKRCPVMSGSSVLLCYCGRGVEESIVTENASFDGTGKPVLLPFSGIHPFSSAWNTAAAGSAVSAKPGAFS